MRLAHKVAVVVGAGQQPGKPSATAAPSRLTFAREGAEVLSSIARPTAPKPSPLNPHRGRNCHASPQTRDEGEAISPPRSALGPIDVLVYNVGIGGAGDGPAHACDDAAFEKISPPTSPGRGGPSPRPEANARGRHGLDRDDSSLASIAGAT